MIQCDVRMLRYVMGIRWQDGFSNEEVVRRSGLEDLEVLLRKNRLRWFGDMRRKGHILRRALNFEVEGRRPPGRPKKTWR